jgi:hypothetical protein
MNSVKRTAALSTLLASLLLSPSVFAQQERAAQSAQEKAPAAKPDVKMLPLALRAQGQALLDEKDEQKRAGLAGDLADDETAAALNFVLAVLETDPSAAVRREIIDELHDKREVQAEPRFWQALERLAASDADAPTAVMALDKLRVRRLSELHKLLAKRMALARRNNDEKAERLLAREDERWISLVNGTMLPAFLRESPPIFSLKESDQPVRVLTLGDFGYGATGNRRLAGEEQKRVAAAMLQAHRQSPFDFGLTLGDNFYPDGMESPTDDRWKTLWSELYEPLGLKFYATLGNHDWHHSDSPAAEILYSQQSQSWRMPAPYYTFTAGPVQFFALDTNEISEAQLLWLRAALGESRARWKVVYGHHPIYSAGQHEDNPKQIERLLPELKGRADVFLAGHDHDLQHLKPEGGIHFFVNGGGGARIRRIEPNTRSLFAHSANGFAMIEADARTLAVKFIGTDLKTLYEYTLTKGDAP